MTLREYKQKLDKLVEDNPKCLDYEIIYSRDDEGNNYQKVIYSPSITKVHNAEEYYLEIISEEEKEDYDNYDNYPSVVIMN